MKFHNHHLPKNVRACLAKGVVSPILKEVKIQWQDCPNCTQYFTGKRLNCNKYQLTQNRLHHTAQPYSDDVLATRCFDLRDVLYRTEEC